MTKQKLNTPKTVKAIQVHDPEILKIGQQMTPEQIVRFLEDFRQMYGDPNQRANLFSSEFQKKMILAILQS